MSDSERDEAGDEADRLRSEIIKSSSFDDDVQWSLQDIKETSSSEEELGITRAVAAGAASTSGPPPASIASASSSASAAPPALTSAPPPASTVPTSAPTFTSISASSPAPASSTPISASSPPSASISASSLPSASSPVEATEGGVASDVLVDQLFEEFTARRAGIVIALTSEFESLYKRCESAKKEEQLCLFGLLDKSWDLRPIDELPPQVPKPTSRISLDMDLGKEEWQILIAGQSDEWLYALRQYMGDQLDINSRVKLFDKVDGLKALHQFVEDLAKQSTYKSTKPRSPREEDPSAGGSKRARMMK